MGFSISAPRCARARHAPLNRQAGAADVTAAKSSWRNFVGHGSRGPGWRTGVRARSARPRHPESRPLGAGVAVGLDRLRPLAPPSPPRCPVTLSGVFSQFLDAANNGGSFGGLARTPHTPARCQRQRHRLGCYSRYFRCKDNKDETPVRVTPLLPTRPARLRDKNTRRARNRAGPPSLRGVLRPEGSGAHGFPNTQRTSTGTRGAPTQARPRPPRRATREATPCSANGRGGRRERKKKQNNNEEAGEKSHLP
ncbi:hypothetical protein GN956_G22782 [Arapaima gigas]